VNRPWCRPFQRHSPPPRSAAVKHEMAQTRTPRPRLLSPPAEQQAFLKAMELLETELHHQDTHG
jgi:hypothetical protein